MESYTASKKLELLALIVIALLLPLLALTLIETLSGSLGSVVSYTTVAFAASACVAFILRLWFMGLENARDKASVLWKCLKVDLFVSIPLGLLAVLLFAPALMYDAFYLLWFVAPFVSFPVANKVYEKLGSEAFPGHPKWRVVNLMKVGFFIIIVVTGTTFVMLALLNYFGP